MKTQVILQRARRLAEGAGFFTLGMLTGGMKKTFARSPRLTRLVQGAARRLRRTKATSV